MSNDKEAISEIAAVSDCDAPHTILHYLYAPSCEAAALIADELTQRGFRTEERLGGDGGNWLVLARHEAIPSKELASIRRSMETLIARVGGEYDGWGEADVRRQEGRSPGPH